ncbi:MAG: hypothetical protein MAG431_01489 [Chloroflexi bacterium]|nr:hypothetical protein [Chloroflexota bacterium]
MTKNENLQFLKLGGSLITDKHQPRMPRREVIARLAEEVAAARENDPGLRLVLGHGSGSFGHVPAERYGTRAGVRTSRQWRGFAEVWRDASALNRIVVEALHAAGVPALTFPPSGAATTRRGKVTTWNTLPLLAALERGLLPVVYGDVVFDEEWGGTILSTENVFAYLAQELHPQRVLLAGIDEGVWADYPACERLLPKIAPADFSQIRRGIEGSAATDVTGGMASKVEEMLALVGDVPGLEVCIFSGGKPANVQRVLGGECLGTRIGL